MKSEAITGKQAVSLMALFIAGSAMITGNASWAKQDSWLSLLLAGVLCLPFALIYGRISSLFPETGFFDALFLIFGRVVGWIICLVMTLYFFQIGLLGIRSFTEFAHVVTFRHTPQIFTAVCLATLCAYTVSKGLGVMGRGATVMLFVVAVMVAFTLIMLIPGMNPENLMPVAGRPLEDIASGAAAWFAFPLAEIVALLPLMGGLKKERGKYGLYIAALCIAVALLLLSLLRNLLVFGGEIVDVMRFPSYLSARVINIDGFFQRMEVFISVYMLICAYVRVSICVYSVSRGVSTLFRAADHRRLAFPVALLGAALSPMLFSNSADMEAWMRQSVWLTIPFQTALPVIIWLGAEICARRRRTKGAVTM